MRTTRDNFIIGIVTLYGFFGVMKLAKDMDESPNSELTIGDAIKRSFLWPMYLEKQ